LPFIGNDVVDLTNQVNASKHLDLRFLKKILTDAEIELVSTAQNPAIALWSFWSCKETAYKVMKKVSADIAFLPRQWKVKISKTANGYEKGEVSIVGQFVIFTRLFISDQYVHCIGSDDFRELDKAIWSVNGLPDGKDGEKIDPSIFVRDCLIRRVAECFHLDHSHLEVRRIKNGGELQPPCIYLDNNKYPIDISLSHDGNFVAYSFITS
jgi:phosphopantetheinyl transferase (holo-ACP synthase)